MAMKNLPDSIRIARSASLAPLALMLVQAGLATMALPVSAATLPARPAAHVEPMVYLAQQSGDDGYGTVPHLRPRPESGVAAPKPAPDASGTTGNNGAATAPRPTSGAATSPKDGRNSSR
ncbi:MAG: hypothetical protein ACKVQQ_04040 [Burkholderiales bacterium]